MITDIPGPKSRALVAADAPYLAPGTHVAERAPDAVEYRQFGGPIALGEPRLRVWNGAESPKEMTMTDRINRRQGPAVTPTSDENPPATPNPDLTAGARQSPEDALSDAEHLFAEGKHWEVIGLTQDLLAQARGHTRQRIRLLRGQAYLRHPDHRRQAIQELEALLAEGPPDAQAHYLLGIAYRDEGLKKRAIGHLRRSLELEPHNNKAERALTELEAVLGS